jgi:hypothetical protein
MRSRLLGRSGEADGRVVLASRGHLVVVVEVGVSNLEDRGSSPRR